MQCSSSYAHQQRSQRELLPAVVWLQVLEKDSHKAPWKYISTISVEQLSFGLLPPTFQGTAQRQRVEQQQLSYAILEQQL